MGTTTGTTAGPFIGLNFITVPNQLLSPNALSGKQIDVILGLFVSGSGTNSTGIISGLAFQNPNEGDDASGSGIAGLGLILELEQEGKFIPVGGTTTDASGRFSFTGLGSGNYRVSVAGRGDARLVGKRFGINATGVNHANPARTGTIPGRSGAFDSNPLPLLRYGAAIDSIVSALEETERHPLPEQSLDHVLQDWSRDWLGSNDWSYNDETVTDPLPS